MNDLIPATGAIESKYDARTIQHDLALGVPLISGGHVYAPEEIEHQHKVGICTAISLVQNAQKVRGKKFSPDFQYLLQKRFDGNWVEGSSIFSALKIGKQYGFLPIDEFTQVTEADRYLSYPEYIAKLKAIPEAEVQRLIGLCVDKLSGYADVDISDPQKIAKAIIDSKAGILCRYTSGSTWWTRPDGVASWFTKDIDPLRNPTQSLSGHAIIGASFDYTSSLIQVLANTWGITWNDENKGSAHVNWNNYRMQEAWIPYYDFIPEVPPYHHTFNTDMQIGQTNSEVMELQKALSTKGYFTVKPTGYYGSITSEAVLKFQIDYVPDLSWYERYVMRGTKAGIKTRTALNKLFA